MKSERSLKNGLARAVAHFWNTRAGQATKQAAAGRKDQGSRGSVMGGKQMDRFVGLVQDLVIDCGLGQQCIHTDSSLELPGYFRPEKIWDLLVIDKNVLLAAIEFKSQIGPSFGNNFNNRSEEAIGTAQDLWTAFREGAFPASNRPWLGYLMLLEDCPRSTTPVAVRQPHFPVFSEFVEASYAERYQLLMTRLIRERLYDSSCFLMSTREHGPTGKFSVPNDDLSFLSFATSLTGRLISYASTNGIKAQ